MLANATYSADASQFRITGVKAGDAAEMETRLAELFATQGLPANIADVILAGVEEGPAWEATLVLAAAGAFVFPLANTRAVAVVAASPEEARLRILQKMDAVATELSVDGILKMEIAGGGDGENFMVLALIALN